MEDKIYLDIKLSGKFGDISAYYEMDAEDIGFIEDFNDVVQDLVDQYKEDVPEDIDDEDQVLQD